MNERPTFEPHEVFDRDFKGNITREAFIEFVRNSHDHMIEIERYIKRYDLTFDEYMAQWDGNLESLDDDIVSLLHEWIEDGTFADIINEDIFKTKADQVDLENVTAQLAQKATKGDIGLTDLNKNKTQFDETWFTDSVKQQWTGDTPVHATPADGGVTTEKLADSAVTKAKTAFIRESGNLYIHTLSLPQSTVDQMTGEPLYSDDNSFSDFIVVDKKQFYKYKGISRVGYYDTNKHFITSVIKSPVLSYEDQMGSDVAYVRLVVNDDYSNTAQFGYDYLDEEIQIPFVTITGENLKEKTISIGKTDFIHESTNLLVKDTITEYSSINLTTGLPVYNDTNHLSDFINSGEGINYSHTGLSRLAFYDSDYELIETVANNPTGARNNVTPPDTKFIRVVANVSDFHRARINEGSTLYPYQEGFHTYLNEDIIVPSVIKQTKDIVSNLNDIRLTVPKQGESKPSVFYKPNQKTAYDGTEELHADTMTSADMYQLWDELIVNHPERLSKKVLGKTTGDSHDMWEISFKPTLSKAKVNIIANLHGPVSDGRDASIALYEYVKDVVENHHSDDTLSFIFNHIELSIIPIANPYGYDDERRSNWNGVDLNRDFDSEEPEVETQLIKQWLQDNDDAMFFVDVHAYGPNVTTFVLESFVVNQGETMEILSDVTSHMIAEKGFSANSRVGMPAPEGTVVRYAETNLNIPAVLLEFPTHAVTKQKYGSEMITHFTQWVGNVIYRYSSQYFQYDVVLRTPDTTKIYGLAVDKQGNLLTARL